MGRAPRVGGTVWEYVEEGVAWFSMGVGELRSGKTSRSVIFNPSTMKLGVRWPEAYQITANIDQHGEPQ